MKILSADPGITTGVLVDDGGSLSYWQIDCRSLLGWHNFVVGVKPDLIIYEKFHYRPNLMKAELYSMQVIGVLRLYAEKHDVPIPFTPIPAEAKKFWDDEKIKKLGLWKPGQGHAMDALRVYLKFKMDNDPHWWALIVRMLKD